MSSDPQRFLYRKVNIVGAQWNGLPGQGFREVSIILKAPNSACDVMAG